MKKYIFILECPETNKVKYVGLTTNPIRKIKYYKYDMRPCRVGDWFKSFKKSSPLIKVIGVVKSKKHEIEAVQAWEEYYKKDLLPKKENKDRQVTFLLTESDYQKIKVEVDQKFNGVITDFIRAKILRDDVTDTKHT